MQSIKKDSINKTAILSKSVTIKYNIRFIKKKVK